MSLFKSASTVSLLTLASRVTGLARDVLMASVFGVSAMTDAFWVAFRLPNLFRRVLGEGAFSQAFVPVLAATRATEGDVGAKLLIDRVASLLALVLLLLSVLGVMAAPVLVWGMASGLPAEGAAAAVHMTRWMFPYIAFMSLVALAGGVLNTWGRFVVPAASPVLLNLAWIAALIGLVPVFSRFGIEPIYALSAGVLLGGVLQLALQIPSLRRLGLLPRVRWTGQALREAWRDPQTRKVARLMLPALLGVSVAQISLLINTQIASHLAPGSVSWISSADRLMEFPTALLGVALGVVLMPQLSAARARDDASHYSALLDWGLRLVVLFAVPCAAALLVFSEPLVAVLFHYGAFGARDVQMVTAALLFYGVGLLGIVAVKVLAPGFYARHDMRTPAMIAVVVLVFTQVLNVILVPWLQHAALTLTISLGALLNALWLLIGLIRRGSYKPLAGWAVFAAQVLGSTALMAAFLLLGAERVNWVTTNGLVRAGLLTAFVMGAGLIYFGALRVSGLKLRQLLRR
ncbi:murein biosynthesis integral membrane protein MurJ [Ottowia thiooxydans]|uniref:murein biosynthesis integral membrane protein MurJ n=1 Tax=Ottowia thiooxydans TaxID=219182 RepID=UPI000404790D|nr:murein biosynthesis integral membrane protein MurJ [Ottowia thiooxydans]